MSEHWNIMFDFIGDNQKPPHIGGTRNITKKDIAEMAIEHVRKHLGLTRADGLFKARGFSAGTGEIHDPDGRVLATYTFYPKGTLAKDVKHRA